jgi:hypothetical protein
MEVSGRIAPRYPAPDINCRGDWVNPRAVVDVSPVGNRSMIPRRRDEICVQIFIANQKRNDIYET